MGNPSLNTELSFPIYLKLLGMSKLSQNSSTLNAQLSFPTNPSSQGDGVKLSSP